jgi:hypothetical protein
MNTDHNAPGPFARNPRSFCFNASCDTLWLSDALRPCLARFGRHLYEIEGGPSARILAGNERQAWNDFVQTIRTLHGYELTERQMPRALRETLGVSIDDLAEAVAMAKIIKFANPFVINPWTEGRITRKAVAEAIASGCFLRGRDRAKTVHGHVARIAWLAQHPETWAPIIIDCIDPDGASFSMVDGYHRTAAAIYLKKPTIRVEHHGFQSGFDALLGQDSHAAIAA